MTNHKPTALSYLWPVAVSMGVFCALNFLWNLEQLKLYEAIEHPQAVYLLGGSGVALVLLWRTLGDGRLTKRDLGLDLCGWSPSKRLLGIAVIVLFAYGGYANLQQPLPPGVVDAADQPTSSHVEQLAAAVKPSWGDFSFWFVLGLAASLAELLVFVAIGFCLVERCLKHVGTNAYVATAIAAVFASVTFGLFHFTHAPIWWPLIFSVYMPVMFINVICFVCTRNFYLMLALHTSFTAIGMTQMQYSSPEPHPSMDLEMLQQPGKFLPTLAAFVVPFLLLHWLEASSIGGQESEGKDQELGVDNKNGRS